MQIKCNLFINSKLAVSFSHQEVPSKREDKSTYGVDHGLGVRSRAAERAVCNAGVGADSKGD